MEKKTVKNQNKKITRHPTDRHQKSAVRLKRSFGRCLLHWILIAGLIVQNPGASPAPASAMSPSFPVFIHGMPPLTPAWRPALMTGMVIDPQNPFAMDFLIDPGESGLENQELDAEITRLCRYFLAALAIPEDEQWVNLAPYEKDRVIPEQLGFTEMGRDLLEQDYLLKQISSSLLHPESETGREFWEQIRKRSGLTVDIDQISTRIFNKIWIVPRQARLVEQDNKVYIAENTLRVMLEDDYLAASRGDSASEKNENEETPEFRISAETTRDVILPVLENEINNGRHFAPLRQIFNSMLLATWYKITLRESILSRFYADRGQLGGLKNAEPETRERVYAKYMESFRQGVYNQLVEEYDPVSSSIIHRSYFSGGIHNPYKDPAMISRTTDTGQIQGTSGSTLKASIALMIPAALFSGMMMTLTPEALAQMNPAPAVAAIETEHPQSSGKIIFTSTPGFAPYVEVINNRGVNPEEFMERIENAASQSDDPASFKWLSLTGESNFVLVFSTNNEGQRMITHVYILSSGSDEQTAQKVAQQWSNLPQFSLTADEMNLVLPATNELTRAERIIEQNRSLTEITDLIRKTFGLSTVPDWLGMDAEDAYNPQRVNLQNSLNDIFDAIMEHHSLYEKERNDQDALIVTLSAALDQLLTQMTKHDHGDTLEMLNVLCDLYTLRHFDFFVNGESAEPYLPGFFDRNEALFPLIRQNSPEVPDLFYRYHLRLINLSPEQLKKLADSYDIPSDSLLGYFRGSYKWIDKLVSAGVINPEFAEDKLQTIADNLRKVLNPDESENLMSDDDLAYWVINTYDNELSHVLDKTDAPTRNEITRVIRGFAENRINKPRYPDSTFDHKSFGWINQRLIKTLLMIGLDELVPGIFKNIPEDQLLINNMWLDIGKNIYDYARENNNRQLMLLAEEIARRFRGLPAQKLFGILDLDNPADRLVAIGDLTRDPSGNLVPRLTAEKKTPDERGGVIIVSGPDPDLRSEAPEPQSNATSPSGQNIQSQAPSLSSNLTMDAPATPSWLPWEIKPFGITLFLISIIGVFRKILSSSADQASLAKDPRTENQNEVLTDTVGGIDLNPREMNLIIEKLGGANNSIPEDMTNPSALFTAGGLIPVVLRISPVHLPSLFGVR